MVRLGALAVILATPGCRPNHTTPNQHSCGSDSECESNHCNDGDCVACATNSDCSPGEVCGGPPRILGGPGGPNCITADAGCASSPSNCPGGGFYCTTCPTGSRCNDATGMCSAVYVPPPAVCGSADFSNGYDAGWGPGPNVSGAVCDTCIGCPFGSECVCGATGLIGGVRCTDPGSALACFATGGAGICEIFPGDCATNSQCSSTPATPFCSQSGTCVQCLRDSDCPQQGGPQGCVGGRCGSCCGSNADCPGYAPECISGFCYPCQLDGGCGPDAGSSNDASVSDGGVADDAGAPDGGDNG